jgi:hypothetical protein
MKITAFWGVASCSLVEVHRCLEVRAAFIVALMETVHIPESSVFLNETTRLYPTRLSSSAEYYPCMFLLQRSTVGALSPVIRLYIGFILNYSVSCLSVVKPELSVFSHIICVSAEVANKYYAFYGLLRFIAVVTRTIETSLRSRVAFCNMLLIVTFVVRNSSPSQSPRETAPCQLNAFAIFTVFASTPRSWIPSLSAA